MFNKRKKVIQVWNDIRDKIVFLFLFSVKFFTAAGKMFVHKMYKNFIVPTYPSLEIILL